MSNESNALLSEASISDHIFFLRGERVMLDFHLAQLYGVPTKALKQQVRRNLDRFPEDFMFTLGKEEWANLRSQIVTSNKRGGNRYSPMAFTRQGVAMLSSVLSSKQAIQMNILIMRTFTKIQRTLLGNEELARMVFQLEQKYDGKFEEIYQYLLTLSQQGKPADRKPIGFQKKSA